MFSLSCRLVSQIQVCTIVELLEQDYYRKIFTINNNNELRAHIVAKACYVCECVRKHPE